MIVLTEPVSWWEKAKQSLDIATGVLGTYGKSTLKDAGTALDVASSVAPGPGKALLHGAGKAASLMGESLPGLSEAIGTAGKAAVDTAHVAADVASDPIFGPINLALKAGFKQAVEVFGSAWLTSGTFSPDTTQGVIDGVQSSLAWVVLSLMIGSILVAGIRMAWIARAEPLRDVSRGVFTTIFVALTGVALTVLAVEVSDLFTAWIVQRAGNAASEGPVAVLASVLLTPAFGPVLLLTILIVSILTVVIQGIIMMIRSVMIILLMGMLPVAASVSGTRWGHEWFSKSLAWLIAFILYKPIAGIIFYVGISLTLGGHGIYAAMMGLATIILSVIALPALVKFMVPVMSTMSAGGGGLAMAGMYAGSQVLAGAPGDRGPSGSLGATGASGVGGKAGMAGISGNAGSAGSAGVTGAAGSAAAGAATGGVTTAMQAGGAALGAVNKTVQNEVSSPTGSA